MAITPKLDLRQGQQLVMTPQLQQAIKLLQLTNLELQEYVEGQLLENPFLERDERASDPQRGDGARVESTSAPEGKDELSFSEKGVEATAARELDTDYDNIDPGASVSEKAEYQREQASLQDWSSAGKGGGHDVSDLDGNANLTREKTLHEHLAEQLNMATREDGERLIGLVLIDMIEDGGYLRGRPESVAERLGTTEASVLKVLSLIQQMDPPGVGARNLSECLRLQLEDQGKLDDRMRIFLEHIHYLGTADMVGLRRATRMSEDELRSRIAEIRSLTPKPGLAFGSDPVQIVVPDVFIGEAKDGSWTVELNSETLPKVLANQRYFTELSATCRDEEERTYLSDQMSNANWLVKSLDQRARTILKVSAEIVRQQDAFFVHGVRHLRPLNLRTVADAISMHESTVSRVTSNKYMSTPRGTFELKYFFTSAIGATTGSIAHSAEAVRHRIGELIGGEGPESILSDDRLVEILRGENIDIARRTIAKYREALGIPSSVVRRRQAQRAFPG